MDRKYPDVLLFFLEGAAISVVWGKIPVRLFLAALYFAYFEIYPAAFPEEGASIKALRRYPGGEADWDLATLTGSPNLGNQHILCENYGCLLDAFPEVSEFVSPSVADLL